MIIKGDFNTTKNTTKDSFQADISNIPKNQEEETVYRILIKDSYFPILCVS